ncbi:MAG: hypothetical protein ACXW3D_06170 [Caulobacteraceae bacterium]
MKFLVQLGYGLAGLGFGYLAYAAVMAAHPFDEASPGDAGELVRLSIVLGASALLLLMFAARPGLMARIVAPVQAAAWMFVAYVMWSAARSLPELATEAMEKLGAAAAAPVEAPNAPLLTWIIALASLSFAAAVFDWLRVMAGSGRNPRDGRPAHA